MSQPENQLPGPSPTYGAPLPPPEQAPEEPARLGPLSRLTGTLLSPGETFADINRKPTWLVATLIAIVIGISGNLFFNWRAKPDWNSMLRRVVQKRVDRVGGQMPSDDQLALQSTIQRYIFTFSPVLKPIKFLIIAGFLALGLMLMQAQATFKGILSVVAWSDGATEIVSRVVQAATLLVRDSESLQGIDPSKPGSWSATSLAAFLSSGASTFLQTIAASFEVFTIWFLILVVIGLVAISRSRKVTTGKTGVLVFGLWIVLVLAGAGLASAFGG